MSAPLTPVGAGLTWAYCTNFWILTMYINDVVQNKGDTERYCLGVAVDDPATPLVVNKISEATAVTNATALILARARLLGAECLIKWARLSAPIRGVAAGRRLTNIQTGGVVRTGESPLGGCNVLGDFVKFRWETASRIHANRDVVGVRDVDVTASVWANANFVDTGGTLPYDGTVVPSSVADPMTAPQQWANYMYQVMQLTYRLRNKRLSGVYLIEPWVRCSYMSAGSRSMGTPFGVSHPRSRIRRTGLVSR